MISMLNCTQVEFSSTKTYRKTQIIVLSVLLGVIVFKNLIAVFITLSVKSRKNCLFCQLSNISFLSNIVAALSLYGAAIFVPDFYRGDIRMCQVEPTDRYFFFYFGIYNSLIVLLANTYLRKLSLTKLFASDSSTDTIRKLMLRYCIPILLVSSVISVISIITQHYVLLMKNLYMETSLLIFAAPLLIIVIATNIHLTFYLSKRKKASLKMNIEQSWRNIEKARNTLSITVKLQTIYTVSWITLIILLNTIGQRNEMSSIVLVWSMRFVFALNFVLESKILILRDKSVQHYIMETLRNLASCSTKTDYTVSTKESSSV